MPAPAVSSSYPLGRYMEDNDYLGDHQFLPAKYQQGTDFDLDEYNGRWCVTPEFPNGTYAYFVAISANGTPVFPYNIGRGYYGSPTGGTRHGHHRNGRDQFPRQHQSRAKPQFAHRPKWNGDVKLERG